MPKFITFSWKQIRQNAFNKVQNEENQYQVNGDCALMKKNHRSFS